MPTEMEIQAGRKRSERLIRREEVLLGDPPDVGFDIVHDEQRWSYLGETNDGRILRVVITFRSERIRVVTAFEPSEQTKMFYLAKKASER